MLLRRTLFGLAAVIFTACAQIGDVAMPTGTKLIVLRHADRSGEDLNETGRARAKALVAALDGIEIDAIYSPGFQRNLDTVAPLAAARGLLVQRLASENPGAKLMAVGAGKTIVWVGNKGNLNALWDTLALPMPAPLEYGDLYFVEPTRLGPPPVTRRHFGPT